MKGSSLLSTAFSLLYLTSAFTIVRSRYTDASLLIRGEPRPGETEENNTPKEPNDEDPYSETKPLLDKGDSQAKTYTTIIQRIKNLPVPHWGPFNPTRFSAITDTRGISPWQVFRNLYLPRAKYQGEPTPLFKLDEEKRPIVNGPPEDLTHMGKKLRTIQYTLELTGEKITLIYDAGERITFKNFLGYTSTFYTTEEGLRKFRKAQVLLKLRTVQAILDQIRWSGVSVPQKRSNVLDTVSNVGSNPAITNSTQDAAAVFEQYLEVFTMLQASIAALISPVLHSVTSQTNLTIVHQMAESIYYDLIGSTTSLDGPFNYGQSFLPNITNMTIVQNNTTVTLGNITEIVTTLEEIYGAMWVQALTAANSTGLYAQQVHIASLLCTNDTSVYPSGFTTIDKSAKADF